MTHRAQYALVAAVSFFIAIPQQPAAPKKLAAPTAALEQEFTTIDGVRELRDGRLILLDAKDQAIHLVDLSTKSTKKLGRQGDGPGEYRLPLSLFASRGDTTLINDMARFRRMMVITPEGAVGGFVPTLDSAISPRNFIVGAADASGRFYENAYSSTGDSNSIVRWDRARGRRDTLARISMRVVTPVKLRVVGNAPPGSEMRARAAPIPFPGLSQWAVAADGRLAIVTPEPYRVSYVGGSGPRVTGPVISYSPIPVTDAEKAEYRAEKQRPVASLSMSRDGATSTSYVKPRYEEPDGWPDWLPAFHATKSVAFAADGTLWVRRHTKAGAPALYDVFDQAAKLAYQLELPAQRKLVGFGSGVVYLARVDDDDLHYVEKYRLPSR
jgi:hypothetical protein